MGKKQCDEGIDERTWVYQRFGALCYFYAGRDCPGWERGMICARIGRVIPKEEEDAED